MLDYTLPHVDQASGEMAVTHLKAFSFISDRTQRLIFSWELEIFSIKNLQHVFSIKTHLLKLFERL